MWVLSSAAQNLADSVHRGFSETFFGFSSCRFGLGIQNFNHVKKDELYILGPCQTLSNFDIHFKSRTWKAAEHMTKDANCSQCFPQGCLVAFCFPDAPQHKSSSLVHLQGPSESWASLCSHFYGLQQGPGLGSPSHRNTLTHSFTHTLPLPLEIHLTPSL